MAEVVRSAVDDHVLRRDRERVQRLRRCHPVRHDGHRRRQEPSPHTSFSYWKPGNSSVAIEATAAWDDDLATKRHVWDLYRATSPRGAGYDLGAFWRSPADPALHVLRLEPWRVQVIRGADLRSRIWTPPA
ncbi:MULTISPECIES: hypothetical protein [unclassified Nonomuraea]|uniref:hypothetical protein n=1 Tax=unclassified Nonomuraea TaxID=2593643 RepID=UPI0033E6C9DA